MKVERAGSHFTAETQRDAEGARRVEIPLRYLRVSLRLGGEG
jgi:hypothetical protein